MEQVPGDDKSSGTNARRAVVEEASNDENASAPQRNNDAEAEPADGTAEPSEPVPQLPESELDERIALMFVVGAPAPVASGRDALLAHVPNQIVLDAYKKIRALCKAHGKALSTSFGNFDQLVGLGWLLGDLVLGGLIEHADAHSVGREAGRLGPDLPGLFAAPRRRTGKLKFSDDEARARAFRLAEEEELTLRQAPASLPLPKRLPRAQQPAPAGAVPEPEPEPAPPEPEPEDGYFAYERIEAEEDMRRFEQCVESATEADSRLQAAQLEMQEAVGRLSMAQRRFKKAQAEHSRRAGKRPPPKPSLAMEVDGEWQRGKEWKETQESADAWKKRMADWNVRMEMYLRLNREADWELADARQAEHEAQIEAHEADEWYQKSLDWDRSSRSRVQECSAELRVSRERRLSEIQAVLEEARGASGGMEWAP